MGRKSTSKQRIEDQNRKVSWAIQLIPVFQEKGIRKFSMDEVAKTLLVSKSTLYKYFHSREEILEYMVEWKLNEIRQFEKELFDPTLPYIKRFFNSLKLTATQISGISNLFLSDLRDLHPSIWIKVNKFIQYAIRVLETYYDEGIKIGALRPVQASLIAATDKFFFTQMANPEFLNRHQLDMEQALKEYFSMKFSGIFKLTELVKEETEQEIADFLSDSFQPIPFSIK